MRSLFDPSHPLSRRARLGVLLTGIGLLGASVCVGYFDLIGMAGLAEPGQPSALDLAMLACELLFWLGLVATGVAAILCSSRRRLRVVVILAAATAVILAIGYVVYRQQRTEWCAAVAREAPAALSGFEECR